MTTENLTSITPQEAPDEQQRRVWEAVIAHNSQCDDPRRTWPTYDQVIDDVAASDYSDTLHCPHDLRFLCEKSNQEKTLCPFGVVCCARLELFGFPPDHPFAPYTGLLTPGNTLNHCILRLSSAIKPPDLEIRSRWGRALLYASGEKLRNAKLFPAAAVKVFRGKGVRSGNLLFGGCKVGQQEENYFSHCMCTQMTERMPRVVKPFVRKFWKYSDHPLSLGTSDFCAHDEDGIGPSDGDKVNFPFALILRPRYKSSPQKQNVSASQSAQNRGNPSGKPDSFDRFLDDVLSIPTESVLFDLFACPTPSSAEYPNKLERIGQIVSTSEMVQSAPGDGLFFRHQRKEDDYMLRPEWKDQLNTKCAIHDGKSESTGTVGTLAGWELFEGHIAKGMFVDFEKAIE